MSSADEQLQIAEKVRSGEYFREARQMYDLTVHDPMTDRYFYIFVTLLALVIFLIAFFAARELYPLNRSVPFIVKTNDIVDDLPHIHPLITEAGETPSAAVLHFLAGNYVTFREEYDIDHLERDTSGVASQSAPDVFKKYQQEISPSNPDSPIALYQRHSRRVITIESERQITPSEMQIIYIATVDTYGDTRVDIKKSRWKADIAFNYSGVELDEKTGKVKPLKFVVTRYQTSKAQE